MKLYATPLGITLITTAKCKANLAAFVQQDGLYNAARIARQTAIYDWELGVSNTFATNFGTRWNTQWAQGGFINYTTEIPIHRPRELNSPTIRSQRCVPPSTRSRLSDVSSNCS